MAQFFRRGVSKFVFAPAVAGVSPTRSEIAAGTQLSARVREMSGWELKNSPIKVPNLASAYTSQIVGEDTTDDSSLTVDDDNAATDVVRTALTKGTTGFMLIFPYGDVPTKRMEKFPVTVTGYNDVYSTGNDAAASMIGFAVTGVPVQNAVVPA